MSSCEVNMLSLLLCCKWEVSPLIFLAFCSVHWKRRWQKVPFLKVMSLDVWTPCLPCRGMGHILVSTYMLSEYQNLFCQDDLLGGSPSFYNITEKVLKCLIMNFIKSSNPTFNVYYILQYLHLDLRWDLVQNIHGTVICFSYYEYVLSLKMASIAETSCWWLLMK